MKIQLRVFLIVFGISFFAALSFNNMRFDGSFLTSLGLSHLIFAALCLLIGIIVLFINRPYGEGLLISAGILLLTGILTCSAFSYQYGA